MTTRIPLVATLLIGISALAALPRAATADDLGTVNSASTMPYLNGGVGKEEQAAMRHRANAFPLRMTFSEHRDGAFVVAVPVTIADAQGKRVFNLPSAGPMLYVKLPDGKYRVSARLGGVTESQDITLDARHGTDVYFHWK